MGIPLVGQILTPRALPPEAPLPMPARPLHAARVPAPEPVGQRALRAALSLTALALAAGLVMDLHAILSGAGTTALQWVMLVLFSLNILPIAMAAVLATAGLAWIVARRLRGADDDAAPPLPQGRTAILIPTYNEDPARVFGTALATAEALAAEGAADRFDLFVLSDTTDPDIWVAEEATFLALGQGRRPQARIFYRRRPINHERKAGNIAEWVRRFGAAYPCFVIFDADSLMTPRTLLRMVARMEAEPRLGLLQTVPLLVNGRSRFARLQQFAAAAYGQVLAAGLALWSGRAGNYWGHNAILRTAAFAAAAGLPRLPGRPPFGGHILSHDFVEAAFLRRAGWDVVIDPFLGGSYEESPPSLIDLAARDRRWAQGNLQHLRVVGARGLAWPTRVHLATGIMAYLAAPIWLGFLLAGLAMQSALVPPSYFAGGPSLFPSWPVMDSERVIGLFAVTMAILLAPKLYGWGLLLADRTRRAGAGGALGASRSVLAEAVVSSLLAPVAMALQSHAVAQILAGRDGGWNAQRRSDGTLPWAVIWHHHRGHTLLGVALAAAALAASVHVALWMSPALLGLLLAAPLSAWTAGASARGPGAFLATQLDHAPPGILREARDRAEQLRDRIAPAGAIERLAGSEDLRRFHAASLVPVSLQPGTVDPDLVVGLAWLDAVASARDADARLGRPQKTALLMRPDAVARIAALSPVLPAAA